MDPVSADNIIKGGILIPHQHVINSVEKIQNKFSLHDIWRIKNPNTRKCKCHPFIFCRLDYWLISDKLSDLVTHVDIQASTKTDRSSKILELEDIKESLRGPGFWKLNTFLLAKPDYVEMISNALPNSLEDAKGLLDQRAKRDWLKFKIKASSIVFSKQLSKDRQRREEELNSTIMDKIVEKI